MTVLLSFFLRIRRPPRSTRTYTLFPDTTLFRSCEAGFHGPGVGIAVSVTTGAVLEPHFPWWTLPETIRATALAYERSGDARFIEFWHRADSRSEEHTSELQSLMRISYAVFCLKKKTSLQNRHTRATTVANT